eukprot:COSAG03_NODE_7355_length_928_cov_1.722892_2_plen_45_part_01
MSEIAAAAGTEPDMAPTPPGGAPRTRRSAGAGLTPRQLARQLRST